MPYNRTTYINQIIGDLKMKKFLVSEDLSKILDKQQTQLMVTTAVSTIGLVFVAVANLVTQTEVEEDWDEVEQLEASKED